MRTTMGRSMANLVRNIWQRFLMRFNLWKILLSTINQLLGGCKVLGVRILGLILVRFFIKG